MIKAKYTQGDNSHEFEFNSMDELLEYEKAKGLDAPDVSISDMGLSTRAFHVLSIHQVLTAYQIRDLGEDALCEFPNLGKSSLEDIRSAMNRAGVKLLIKPIK